MKRMIGCLTVAMLLVLIAQMAWADTHQKVEVFPQLGDTVSVPAVVFSPDGRLALSGSDDATLRLWDLGTGRELRRFSGHALKVTSVAFSPDGRLILSGNEGWHDAALDYRHRPGDRKLR